MLREIGFKQNNKAGAGATPAKFKDPEARKERASG